MTKRCGRCGKDKPLDDFHRRNCGGAFHPAAMQWDHRPGTVKLADVSDLRTRTSKRRVLEEIEKCELVCANCHAVRTFLRDRGVAQPG
jgi:hypothetical protein